MDEAKWVQLKSGAWRVTRTCECGAIFTDHDTWKPPRATVARTRRHCSPACFESWQKRSDDGREDRLRAFAAKLERLVTSSTGEEHHRLIQKLAAVRAGLLPSSGRRKKTTNFNRRRLPN